MSIQIVHELRRAQGRNKKLDVLERHKDNEVWKRFLWYVYNETLNYYASAPSDKTFVDDTDFEDMFAFLDDLRSQEYSGKELRMMVTKASQVYGEPLRLVLDRSLKAGISTTSINNVYPGLIPTFEVMLAKDVAIPRYPVLASTKYDGVRVIARVEKGQVNLYTRAGKLLEIDSLIDQMGWCGDGVYDGELVIDKGKQEGRTKITGQVNRVLKGSATDCHGYKFFVFDHLLPVEWDLQNSHRTYQARVQTLQANLKVLPNVAMAPIVSLPGPEQVNQMFEDHINQGYEGIMLRYPDHLYEWTRTTNLIKKKAINNTILRCVGIQGGTGKYEGLIGALLCEGKVNGKQLKVKVGSGLSDYDRSLNPLDYVNKKVEVMYNDVVTSDGVVYSLFLPRFKRLRGDLNV